jgi:endonuclease YncB( thermonuclease family)
MTMGGMTARRLFSAALLLILFARPVPAAEPPLQASLGEGSDLTLADGRQIHLAGIELAHRPIGERSAKPWPLAVQARQMLESLTAPPLLLTPDGADTDRYGRWPMQAVTLDGRWLQGELLRQGLARVATTPGSRSAIQQLLAAEAPAREAKLGLWAERDTALRAPDQLLRWLDSVQVVEGRVTSAALVKGAVYLNFGEDWHRMLAVRIPKPLLVQTALDPLRWTGHRLRVRGWVGKGIGPLIEVSHMEQIEVLDGASPP